MVTKFTNKFSFIIITFQYRSIFDLSREKVERFPQDYPLFSLSLLESINLSRVSV